MNETIKSLAKNISSLYQNAKYVEKKSGKAAVGRITGKLIRKSVKIHVQTEFSGDFKRLPKIKNGKTRRKRAILLEKKIHEEFEIQLRELAGINGDLGLEKPIRWEHVEARFVVILANQFCQRTVELHNLLNGVLSVRVHTLRGRLGCPQLPGRDGVPH